MGFGLLSIIKLVPWSEVIGNAPQIADGARRLWNTVAKKPAVQEAEIVIEENMSGNEAAAALERRIAAAEAAATSLHAQMLTCSALINELAEQNAQLIKRIDTMRSQFMWLTTALAVLVAAFVAWFLAA